MRIANEVIDALERRKEPAPGDTLTTFAEPVGEIPTTFTAGPGHGDAPAGQAA